MRNCRKCSTWSTCNWAPWPLIAYKKVSRASSRFHNFWCSIHDSWDSPISEFHIFFRALQPSKTSKTGLNCARAWIVPHQGWDETSGGCWQAQGATPVDEICCFPASAMIAGGYYTGVTGGYWRISGTEVQLFLGICGQWMETLPLDHSTPPQIPVVSHGP